MSICNKRNNQMNGRCHITESSSELVLGEALVGDVEADLNPSLNGTPPPC